MIGYDAKNIVAIFLKCMQLILIFHKLDGYSNHSNNTVM